VDEWERRIAKSKRVNKELVSEGAIKGVGEQASKGAS